MRFSNPLFGLGFLVAVALVLRAFSCVDLQQSDRPKREPTPISAPTPLPAVEPVNDGNGVFYFEATGEQYRASLSKFYEKNPGKHCDLQGHTERIEFDPTHTAHAVTTGFILHCHDIAVNAQDVTVP